MIAFPELDRSSPATLTRQIADFFADAIESCRLSAGDRLPTIRLLAKNCGVTRATAQDAYRQLSERGLVESTVGRGTTVLGVPGLGVPGLGVPGLGVPGLGVLGLGEPGAQGPGSARAQANVQEDARDNADDRSAARRTLSPFAQAVLQRTKEMPGAPLLANGQVLVANFAELDPDSERFPVDEWRAAMDAVLQERGPELLGYGWSANGLPELREAFAARARESDPSASAGDILVTGGAQQALDLALRTFCTPGDGVVVTDPSYHQMFGLLHAHGLQAVTVPFRADGLDLERLARVLRRPNVRLVYLMPTFHNPTGRTLSVAQREALMAIITSTSVPVVEDEYQHALRFRGEPLPSLRSLDPRGLTVTVASASKELFPALRIGWVTGASQVIEPMAAVKRFVDLETSALLQAGLAEFIARGSFDRYLAELRLELRRRHATLVAACKRYLPDGCRVTEPDGGYVAWLEMPEPGQADRLAELANERGVRVVAGRAFGPVDRPSIGVRLSLTRADTEQIEAGVAVLGQCADEILAAPAEPIAAPFL